MSFERTFSVGTTPPQMLCSYTRRATSRLVSVPSTASTQQRAQPRCTREQGHAKNRAGHSKGS